MGAPLQRQCALTGACWHAPKHRRRVLPRPRPPVSRRCLPSRPGRPGQPGQPMQHKQPSGPCSPCGPCDPVLDRARTILAGCSAGHTVRGQAVPERPAAPPTWRPKVGAKLNPTKNPPLGDREWRSAPARLPERGGCRRRRARSLAVHCLLLSVYCGPVYPSTKAASAPIRKNASQVRPLRG